jgi:HPt (histidine-containing phosphotransfer) domain-containing protein
LDPTVWDDLRALQREGHRGLIQGLLASLAEEVPPLLREIADAVAAGDASRLARAAHAVKGTAANLGALDLLEVCAKLEQCGRQAELDQLAGLVEAVQQHYADLRQAMEHEARAAGPTGSS